MYKVDQIINYAFQRTKKQAKRPFFVITDEAAELTSNDLPYSLQALRKFGIYFTLCYQTLTQIRRVPGYYENVMTNCDVKIAFKSSRQDSEELVGELFAGEIHGNVVKEELYRTMLIPQESVREVRSTSFGRSRTRGEVLSEGSSEGSSNGIGSSHSHGYGVSNHIVQGDGLLHSHDIHSISESHSSGYGSNEFSGSSSGYSSSRSDIFSDPDFEARGTALVPFYEYLREQELSSRTYYTIEEMKEKYIAWIMCQPQRHAHIKLKDDRVMPVFISFVEEVRALEKEINKVIQRSNERYALPVQSVDALLVERRLRIVHSDVPLIDVQHEEETISNQRWQ